MTFSNRYAKLFLRETYALAYTFYAGRFKYARANTLHSTLYSFTARCCINAVFAVAKYLFVRPSVRRKCLLKFIVEILTAHI